MPYWKPSFDPSFDPVGDVLQGLPGYIADKATSVGQGVLGAVTLPGDVYSGKAQMSDDATQQRALDMVSMMAGAGAPAAEGGAAGIFGGKLSQGADLAKAKQAELMLRAKGPADEVFKQTGWFRGLDGKMRYEIPDPPVGNMLKPTAATPPDAPMPYFSKVGEEVDHPGLLSAYPSLSGALYKNDPVVNMGSWHDPYKFMPNGGMSLNMAQIAGSGTAADTVAIHELQHAVQGIEGFHSTSRALQEKEARDVQNRAITQDYSSYPATGNPISPAAKNWLDVYAKLSGPKT